VDDLLFGAVFLAHGTAPSRRAPLLRAAGPRHRPSAAGRSRPRPAR
jgi:hypothetical protein